MPNFYFTFSLFAIPKVTDYKTKMNTSTKFTRVTWQFLTFTQETFW